MTRDVLLTATAGVLAAMRVTELEHAEESLARLERTGAPSHAHGYLQDSLVWLNRSVSTVFGSEPPENVRLEVCQAVLRAPLSAWRASASSHWLQFAYVDHLRDVAQNYGLETSPLRPDLRSPRARAEPPGGGGGGAVSAVTVIRSVFEEWARLLSAQTALDRIAEVFGLNATEMGRMFGVTRQAVDQWRVRGVPEERRADVDRARELADVFHREFLPDRIPQIVRHPVAALGGRTVLDVIRGRETERVHTYLRDAFAFTAA